MLDYVDAVRFDRRMNKGRTWPCLIACSRLDGEDKGLETADIPEQETLSLPLFHENVRGSEYYAGGAQ